jgi:hypothetical protein
MRLRIRGPSGQSTITLDDAATIQTLKDSIQKETGLGNFDVKYGYPPKILKLDQWPPSRSLTEIDIKLNGERESYHSPCPSVNFVVLLLYSPVCRDYALSKVVTTNNVVQN